MLYTGNETTEIDRTTWFHVFLWIYGPPSLSGCDTKRRLKWIYHFKIGVNQKYGPNSRFGYWTLISDP